MAHGHFALLYTVTCSHTGCCFAAEHSSGTCSGRAFIRSGRAFIRSGSGKRRGRAFIRSGPWTEFQDQTGAGSRFRASIRWLDSSPTVFLFDESTQLLVVWPSDRIQVFPGLPACIDEYFDTDLKRRQHKEKNKTASW